MEWNCKQKEAYELAKFGINLLLLGHAGTGKSTLLKAIIQDLKEKEKNVVVLAYTGVAAYNIGGQTIHSFLRLPAKVLTPNQKVSTKILEKVDVVILDEVSMCRIDVFSTLAKAIRKAEEKVCKKIQFIVSGDFYQIPPVIPEVDRIQLETYYRDEFIPEGFPFACNMWKDFRFTHIILEEVMRQSDKEFCEKLNEVRLAKDGAYKWFNQRCQKEVTDGIVLSSYRNKVREINEESVEKIDSYGKYYCAEISRELDAISFGMPVDKAILVKKGMKVMTLINDIGGEYENGSIGTVVGMYEDCIEIHFLGRGYSYVKPHKYSVIRHEFVNGKIEQKIIGYYTQLPIQPAYAITVHKCQGMTLDKVNIEPDFFAPHMAYVALSRCKSVEGIGLLGELKEEHISTLPCVNEFYDSLS